MKGGAWKGRNEEVYLDGDFHVCVGLKSRVTVDLQQPRFQLIIEQHV